MKTANYLMLLSMLAFLLPVAAFAGDKNRHSVEITDPIKVGSQQLKPGNYKVEWDGSGPKVQVKFQQNGKTVASAPATLQTNDKQVTQDDVVTDTTASNTKTLKELDFVHDKEALIFRGGI